MITCIDKAVNYFDMHESTHNLLYDVTKLSDVFDRDVSRGLNYDEFRYAFSTFAAYTGAIMWSFDTDNDDYYYAYYSDYDGLTNGAAVEARDNFYKEWNWESARFRNLRTIWKFDLKTDDLEI